MFVERRNPMRKIEIIVMCFLSLLCFNGCGEKENQTDASKFKEEYEALNGKLSKETSYRTVQIQKDNPIIYKTSGEFVSLMEAKESFVLYLGSADCPWCRSMISSFLEVASDLNISVIYYVDLKNSKTEDDQKLLDILDSYILKQEDDKKGNVVQRKVASPSIVSVVDGTVTQWTDGISPKQTEENEELTEEMKKDSYEKIKCSIQCVADHKNLCLREEKCS